MKLSHLAAISLAAVGLAGCATSTMSTRPVGERACTELAGTALGIGVIEKAEHVAKDVDLISPERRAFLKATAKVDLPPLPAPRDVCRVSANLSPVPGSLIKVQIWLPGAWNQKFVATGGFGFNGGMSYGAFALFPGAQRGFATMITDVGHDAGESAKFAYESREKLIDYGHRANHVAATFTKELIAHYYGKPARLSYFIGGSNGGREALMEARRYPEDYDAIVARYPAMSFTKLMASFLWNRQAIRDTPGASGLKDKLPILHAAVLKKCDAIDGATDGIIANPTLCAFDPAEIQCKAGDGANCLNAAEISVVQKIYSGPRFGDGRQFFPGMALGGEGGADNWLGWLFAERAQQASGGEEFARWMVHGNPDWQVSQFDLYKDFELSRERVAPIVDSDDPDLSPFLGRGGILLLEHGWSDSAVPPGSTLNYYTGLREKVGAAIVDRQVRLFMVPGMGHVSGGPVPDEIPLLDELDRWAEGAPAPEVLVASQYDLPGFVGVPNPAAKAIRTRPICAWPKHARYDGSGSVDDQRSFRCQ